MEEETKKNGRTLLVVILAVVAVVIVGVVAVVFRHMHKRATLFDVNDEKFYYYFANCTRPGEYEVHSLDAYYLEDEQEYFYNAKYSLYLSPEEGWAEIDEVLYGVYGKFRNFFCLNWDDFDGYEEAKERFERAQKEGVHKTYTLEEIGKRIAAAREEIAREEAEFEAQNSGDE